ncbi:MAG: ubiquitin-like domain-containing protein [bacterium]|nr:ubiquitin-like domain-containing protein [bacterium]
MFGKIIQYPTKSKRKQKIVGAFSFLALAFGGILLAQSLKPAEATGEGAKVLTVFENSKRISFKTDATTIREALKEQNIEIGANDSVEPSLNEELTDTDYNVNIYRANPYVIADGETRTKVMTAAKTSKKIAEAAGLKIFDEDVISSAPSQNILEDGAVTVLTVKRAKNIKVKLFGKEENLRTQAETVADFLAEKNIKLGENDQLSVALNTKISEGTYFEIWRNGKQTITVDEEITFETEKIQDSSKNSTYNEVRQKGENGAKTVVYEIEMQNGVEVSRSVISEVQTKAPVKEVRVVGTKVNLPAGSHEDWMRAAGISESDFGYVNFIITKESTWRPTATNGRYYGLYQTSISTLASHGCSGESLNDPICQLRSANIYRTRYGTWEQAYNAWQRQGWW